MSLGKSTNDILSIVLQNGAKVLRVQSDIERGDEQVKTFLTQVMVGSKTGQPSRTN
jgi:hypothetical protein